MGVNGLLEVKEEKNLGVTTRNQVRVCDFEYHDKHSGV